VETTFKEERFLKKTKGLKTYEIGRICETCSGKIKRSRENDSQTITKTNHNSTIMTKNNSIKIIVKSFSLAYLFPVPVLQKCIPVVLKNKFLMF
jgi:hypothetical protein